MMKKYIKQLALSVLTLCMIFTLATGNVVNAAKKTPVLGDELTINFKGININPSGSFSMNGHSVSKTKFTEKKSILINPTSKSSDLSWILNGLYTGPVQTDSYGNEFYNFITKQTRYVNGEQVVYRLVGFREVGEGGYSERNVDKYLENFCRDTEEDALKLVNLKLNDYIGIDEYNSINEHPNWDSSKGKYTLDLAAVYTTEEEKMQIDYGKGPYTYYKEGTEWAATKKVLDETTNEIKTSVDFDKKEITFTIPENFDGDNIQLTLNDELVKLFTFRFLSTGAEIIDKLDKPGWDSNNPYVNIEPGDRANFKINIINKSKYDYGYVDKSLVITTTDLSCYYNENDVEHSYTVPTETEMYGFDGQRLLNKFSTTRIPNEALRALAGDDVNDVLKDDQALGQLLDNIYCQGENVKKEGIKNLNKYYIDYYNAKYASANENYENKKKIEEFGVDTIKDMFFNELQSFMDAYETNKEVGETLYNYFYNAVLGVAPAELLPRPDSEELGDSYLNSEYALGNFMRNGNDTFEKYMTKTLGLISNDNTGSADWGFQIDGQKCFNIYNFMDYGFDMGFKLEKKVGDVTVKKDIESDDINKDNAPIFMFKLTDSKGVEYFKTILYESKELNEVVFKDIPYGKYTVEEIDPIRYEVLGQPILEGVLDDVKQSGYVHYVNTKVKDNDFSDTNLVINHFEKGDKGIEISQDSHNNGKRG